VDGLGEGIEERDVDEWKADKFILRLCEAPIAFRHKRGMKGSVFSRRTFAGFEGMLPTSVRLDGLKPVRSLKATLPKGKGEFLFMISGGGPQVGRINEPNLPPAALLTTRRAYFIIQS
jgi:hypothetical protein